VRFRDTVAAVGGHFERKRRIFLIADVLSCDVLKGRLSIWKSYSKKGGPDFIEHGVLC